MVPELLLSFLLHAYKRFPHRLCLPDRQFVAVDHVAHELLPPFKEDVAGVAFCGEQDLHVYVSASPTCCS